MKHRHPHSHSSNPDPVRPRIIAFEVTRRCPLRCRHCRAAAYQGGADPLSTEQCRRILDGIADFNTCVIILTGGEPMERKDIFELTRYGRSLGLRMVMATCGFHINDQSILQLKEAGILAFSFSLDGATSKTHDAFRGIDGAFDTVLHAVEKAKQTEIRFQINTTITKLNLHEVPAIADLAVKLGAYCFNPFILVPVGRADELRDLILDPDQYEQLLKDMAALKQHSSIEVRLTCGPQFARVARQEKIDGADRIAGCLAATEFAFISHTGQVQTCGFLNVSAGSLVDNGYDFKEIWLHSEYLNSLRDHNLYKGACGSCGYLAYCRGCRARAYTMLGDYLQQDPICKLARPTKGVQK
ncbi:MAG: radical SAM protein [Sedimentisphaerales bacterium]|nr:radical SAM protein [Sedimentisphaerales bacterium]